MYSKRTIRTILKKVAASSIYKVAKESGIAYSTICDWLAKNEIKLKRKAEKNSLLPIRPRTDFFSISFTLSSKIPTAKVIYLVVVQDLISKDWIFCFTLSKNDAAKRFLENVIKNSFNQMKDGGKSDSEFQPAPLRQLRYQALKKFKPLIAVVPDFRSIHELLTAGSCFYLLQRPTDDFLPTRIEPFIITGFDRNQQPDKIIKLADSALKSINNLLDHADSLSFKNIINLSQSNITKEDLINLDPLTLFDHSSDIAIAKLEPFTVESEKSAFTNQFAGLSAVIKIQFKKIFSQTTNLPGFLIVAYDIKRGIFNFCFTFEKNKSNKTLYLLYINHFYKSYGVEKPGFIVDLDLADINSFKNIENESAINWNISKIVAQLQSELDQNGSKADLIIKSSVFLAKSNSDLSDSLIIHPPFILEDIVSTFDFNKNQLLLNQFSLDVNNSVINVLQQNDFLHSDLLEKEKLLKLYNFLKNQKIDYPELNDKIIAETDTMQLSGDLPQSEMLLELMLKNSLLNSKCRGKLYATCGVQKFITGDTRSARSFFKKAITESRLCSDFITEFEALRNISGLYIYQGMLAKGYRYLRMAQKIINAINDNFVFTRFHFLLGHYYYKKNLFKQAAIQFENSAEYAKKAKLADDYTNSITGIANCLLKLNRPKQALKYAKKASQRYLSSNLKIPLAISYLTCSQCYTALKMERQAVGLMVEQMKVLKTINYPALEFQSWLYYIKLLLLQENKSKAREAFQELSLKTSLTEIDNISLQKNFAELKKEFLGK